MARETGKTIDPTAVPAELPLLILEDAVVFPGPVAALSMEGAALAQAEAALRGPSPLLALAHEQGDGPEDAPPRLRPVGTIARVVQIGRDADGDPAVLIEGLFRARMGEVRREGEALFARVEVVPRAAGPRTPEVQALGLELKKLSREILELLDGVPRPVAEALQAMDDAEALADLLAFRVPAEQDEKLAVLQELDPAVRLRRVVDLLGRRREVLKISNRIDKSVSEELGKAQREHLLRQRMKAIRSELDQLAGSSPGDDEGNGAGALEKQLAAAGLPPEVRAQADKELARLRKLPEQSPEVSVARTWLQWVADLPWSVSTEDALDLGHAQAILDADHEGLAKVKRRITEYLAVRALRSGAPAGGDARGLRAPILCLVGPPGVGKTSLGQSIARAMGRKFVRVSLGGVRDEAEIRGHRRTYVGAMPGRFVQALKRAGSNNPVVMLDEVDKLGRGAMGDPSAALLELLDPEQNHAFSDHYLEVPFDLSRVLFIATANGLDGIPGPLRDRMEVLEIPSYTLQEKAAIARRHLLPRQRAANGLAGVEVHLDDFALEQLISGYTREAGVRGLERRLADLCRAIAVERAEGRLAEGAGRAVPAPELARILGPERYAPEALDRTAVPGVATGLAWTPVGGDVLFVEATQMPGTGKLILTGQLGEVMRESAQAALSYVKANAVSLGLPEQPLQGKDVHVHVPSGGTPKDGPSAGVTLFTALVSLLTGVRVRGDVAMTGEATLRGRVLPVGGIKEKVLAAHRLGLRRIVLPSRCRHDVLEVPEAARKDLEFVFVDRMEQVLEAALETSPLAPPLPGARPEAASAPARAAA